MNVPRLFKRHLIRWRTLHKAVTICVLASLLAGLIPPPVVGTTLPTAFAEPIAALLPDTPVALAAGTISGTVFQDFNSDGSLSSGTVTDIGMAGVTVTVYDSDGAAQGTDQTDATGGYSIAATGTGPYRVEFTTLPTGYYPTTHNSNSGSNTTAPNSTATTAGTTVQFVPDGNSSNVNLGINRPEAYAQSDVRLAVPMQLAGDQSETSAVLYDWPYTNSGTTPTARTAAQASQIGTTWGLAYQRTTKTLFASAVVRRHAGLGSLGLGGIYQIDYASGSPVASTFVDLDAAPFSANFGTLGNNSTRGLPATPTTASQDTSAFAAVAKEGIGDIDLSEDGNTLWVVNLNGVTSNVAGTLLALDVTGGTAPTSATSYAISSFSGLPTCTNGVLRPWALKFANGKGYLGAVCSAELAGGVRDNLVGYVLSFDPDAPTAFTTELTIPMGSTYGKGIALQLTSAADLPNIAPNTEQWYPWTDTYTDVSFNRSPNGLIVARPTPVLSDIEFDESGHLIVGFLDRAAMQLGSVNYPPTSTAYTIQVIGSGDVVRACVDGAGTYTLESNGACGGLNGAGVGNGDGPGGGEYYHDLFTLFTLQHQEILNGGLAVLAGTREIAATAFDPVTSLDTAGILFLANSTGAKNDGYQVGPTNQKNSTNGYFAKSFGIGDIELLADPAPLEIGNRVWNDADSDGLQDPNEAPISGVTVELYKNGVKVGQATTDATGEYYFTSGTSASDANTSDNIIHDSGIGILPGTGANGGDSLYEIRIPNVSGGSKQAALGSNSLTTANAGSDSIDSDGSISGVNASYAIPYADLAGSGYNNHTYDFGFGPPTGTIQIVKNTVGDDGTFAFTSADTQLDAVSITTVGNTGNSGTAFTKNAGAYTISEDALPANWALTNLTCSGDSDSGSTITLASRQVVIDLDAGEAIVCTFTNTYTAPVADFGDLPTAAQSGFASNYPATLATNGASHETAAILRIGAQIDSESDGQPNANADGDDATGTPDDEDGVQFKTPLRPGANGIIAIGVQQPLNSTVHLNGWIDFNQDGDFADSGEQIATDVTSSDSNVRTDASQVLLDFSIPSDAISGFTYARFRLCTAAGSCNTPTGAATDGEVEDYRVEIPAVAQLGNYVWLDTSGDGVQQGSEPGVEGAFVKLYRVSDNVLVDVATTDATGYYSFTNLLPATYYLEFAASSGYTFTTALQGGNAANDSDADQATGRTGNIVLAGGDNDQSWDAGLITTVNQLTYCEALPWGLTEVIHTFTLPKFNPALGTLMGVSISDYVGLRQWIGGENRAANAQNVRLTTTSDAVLMLPDSTTLDTSVGLNTGFQAYAAYDGITDMSGVSSFSYSDWQYVLNTNSASYATLSDFIAASPGQTVDLPFETLSGFTTTGGGGNISAIQRTYAVAGVCVNYNYTPVAVSDPGGFSISKAIATTDGSNPSVSGSFAVVVSCPGVSGYPATLSLNANGTPITAGNLVSGTVCSFSENTLTLPAAPGGYTWVNAQISPASITIASNMTATVTAHNTLAPLPEAPTGVLTVTKTISGTGTGPFNITVTGPSGVISTTTINGGETKLFTGLASGVYTVTESTPAGWTTVYTATTSAGSVTGSTQAVVTLANENSATLAATPISGKVFRDFNSDGQITANGVVTDTGVAGVTVTAYDKGGNSVGSVTSDSNGAYTITPTGDGPYRVEFSNLPSGYEPTTHGTANGTSTQFVTAVGGAGNVNLGILDPCDYCEGLPRIVAQTYVNRDIATAFTRTLVSMPYTVGGLSIIGQGRFMPGGFAPYYDQSKVTTVVDAVEMGATFGLAYQRNSRTIFAAAFMKASDGTPATSNGFGPGGPGAIYQIAPGVDGVAGTTDDVPTVWLDINSAPYAAVLGANAAGADPHVGGTSAQADAEYHAVGKIGFGGMAIGPDDETLYTINLNQRALYILPIGANQAAPAATLITTQDIPYPADCTSGTVGNPDVRPFALTIHRNQGYVGLVCTAESTQDKDALRAYVYPFDLSTGVFGSSVLNEPLTYTRASLVDPVAYRNRWFAWTVNNTQVVNQPWLTDLQFDGDDLILAFRNRLYDQRGDSPFTNGGDVLRACAVGGVLTLESNGTCGSVAGAAANGQFFAQGDANSPWSLPYGPGGGYYYLPRNSDGGDSEIRDSVLNGNKSRLSAALGGLALLPGAIDTIITQVDPSEFHNAGLMWVRNSVLEPPANRAGYSIRAFQVLPNSSAPVPGEALYGGKGSGMGDMVLLCDPAPIEIGNRVWDDLDSDGVQDPGEPGLDNVTVTAMGSDGSNRTATTDVDGNYYFTATANTAYTLTITSPSGYSVTTPNAAALSGASVSSNHAISDTRDSDAVLVGGVATIYYTTGSAGQNNHGLDFGFTKPASGQVDILNTAPVVSLGNRVWYDTNNNGAVDGGEQNVGNGVTVELYQDSDSSGDFSAGDSRLDSTVTSGGYYTFTNLTPSSSDATRYLVVITDTNFLAGGLLYGYHNSAGQVTDNSLAADDNKDHGAVSGTLGQNGGVVASSAISLTAGTQPTGEANEGNDPIQSATDANSNQTIDFGFYSLSVGNRVWIDDGAGANADNGQLDSGENGLDGVTVELLNSSNAVVSTTTTSNGGYYTFTGLISGTYNVRISGYPATYRSSTDTVNAAAPTSADDDDNGPGTGTGTLTSSGFALVPGSSANGHSADNATGVTSNPRIDFGLYAAPASFALDKRLVSPVSGVAAVGDPVVYTLVVTNTGAITLTTITLVDSYDANWLQYNSASTAPTAQATGVLTWTLTSPTTPLPLSAGEVMTVTVTFTAVKP